MVSLSLLLPARAGPAPAAGAASGAFLSSRGRRCSLTGRAGWSLAALGGELSGRAGGSLAALGGQLSGRAGGSLAALGGALDARAVFFKWTGGGAPSSRLTSAASSVSSEWVPLSKPAGWVEEWDETEVTAHEILMWCISDTERLLKETPPPPLDVHDVPSLVGEYDRLYCCAETESVEITAATREFIKLQVKTRQCYGEVVKGYRGGLEAIEDVKLTVNEASSTTS